MLRNFDIKRLLRRFHDKFNSQYKNLQSRIFTVTHKESRIKAALSRIKAAPCQTRSKLNFLEYKWRNGTPQQQTLSTHKGTTQSRYLSFRKTHTKSIDLVELYYIYIYISRFSRCNSKRAATVGGHRAKAEEEGTPAGRCCLADCVVGKKRGRSSGREGKRAEVALIINNPLLRRGCSAFVLGLVRGPGSPSVPGIPPPSLTLTCNAATGAPTIRMTIH